MRTKERLTIRAQVALGVLALGVGVLAAIFLVKGEAVVVQFQQTSGEVASVVRTTNGTLVKLPFLMDISRSGVRDSASVAVLPSFGFLITDVSARGPASDLEGKIEICLYASGAMTGSECATQASGFTRVLRDGKDAYRAIVYFDNPVTLTPEAHATYAVLLKTNLAGTNIRSFRLSTEAGQAALGLDASAPRVAMKSAHETIRVIDELKGDVNNNAKIEASDAQRVMVSLSGGTALTEQERGRADVNEDTRVDMVDALGILARATGMKFSDYTSVRLSLGDANGDGAINATDALMVAKHVEGGARLLVGPQLRVCDVDQDGRVTVADSKVLLAYGVGSIKKLPVKFGDVYPKGAPDGLYTLADVGLMQKYAVNNDLIPAGERLLADVNLDGAVNSTDTLAVMKAQQGQLQLPLLK